MIYSTINVIVVEQSAVAGSEFDYLNFEESWGKMELLNLWRLILAMMVIVPTQ